MQKVHSSKRSESKEHKSLDMNEFDALNQNIAKASSAEIERFRELAQLYAQKQVEDFQFSEEKQKEIIEKNWSQSEKQSKEENNSAQDYILEATQPSQIPLDYVWAYVEEYQHLIFYTAYLCRTPGIPTSNLEYKLFVQERFNEKRVVFEEYFSEVPAFSFALGRKNLWFMKHETNQLRIISFDWNHEEEVTQGVRDQLFTLPKGVEIKRELYSNEAIREKMAQNMMEQNWPNNYASPSDIEQLKNSQFSPAQNLYNNQILVMLDQKVFLNTVEKGVLYFDLKEIAEDKQQLELSDFKKHEMEVEEGYSVSFFVKWMPWEEFISISQTDDGKKLKFQAFVPQDDYAMCNDLTVDIPTTIIKAILYQSNLYALDLDGNVSIHLGGSGQTFAQVMKHCTDIVITDSLFAIQHSLDQKGQLVSQVLKREGQSNESLKDLQISQVIAMAKPTSSYFSHCLSTAGLFPQGQSGDELLLLANGSTMYIRNETRSEWIDGFMLDAPIIALYSISESEDQEAKIICITETSIETWGVDQSKQRIIPDKKRILPLKVISARQSEQAWGDSNILLLTVNNDADERTKEVCLWTCSPQLTLSLLLRDDSKTLLDRNSFYNFYSLEMQRTNPNDEMAIKRTLSQVSQGLTRQLSAQESQPTSQLSLMCTTGASLLTFCVYTMPEAQPDTEDKELSIKQEPVAGILLSKEKEIEDLNFEGAKILAIFRVKTEAGNNYVMIAQGRASSIIILDKELKVKNISELEGIQISQVTDYLVQYRYLFALNSKQNLIAVDMNLCVKGIPPYQIVKYDSYCSKVLTIDKQNVKVYHASGLVQNIKRQRFRAKRYLEQSAGKKKYLAWQQKGNIFAAVDRFNVVSFWNTHTSKLIYKKVLEGTDRIQDAELFRSFDFQNRYEDSSNLFDQLPQAIVSLRQTPYMLGGNYAGLTIKMVKLDLFVKSQTRFDASCRTPISGIMRFQDVVNILEDNTSYSSSEAPDQHHVYFFNEELNCILRSIDHGEIGIYRPKKVQEKSYLGFDVGSREINETIGLKGISEGLLENHISPDGKHILIFTEGVKIYKFVEVKTGSQSKILIKPTEWIFPMRTDNIEKAELASRVKFESGSVIRYLTRSKRDILYMLEKDGKHVRYIGEVKLDNLLQKNHLLVHQEFEDKFEHLKQNSGQVKSNWQHIVNLQSENQQIEKDLHQDLKVFDSRTDIKMSRNGEGFYTHLSFIPFEWYLAEMIVANKATLEVLDDKQELKLTLMLFPSHNSSFLHMIAASSNVEDQSVPASQLRDLLDAEQNFIDGENSEDDSAEQFQIPMLQNKQGELAFWKMHESGLRVLVETMMDKIQFHRVVQEQNQVAELLEQEDPSMIKFFESSFQVLDASQKVDSLLLPVGTHIVTFRSESATLDLKEIQQKVNESIPKKELLPWCREKKTRNTKIDMMIMDIGWLLHGKKGFLDLAPILEDYERDNLFNTKFMQSLTHEYWMVNLKRIIKSAFIPWVTYSALSLVYFAQTLNQDFVQAERAKLMIYDGLGVLILILIIYLLYIEIMQGVKDGLEYFKSMYNYIDMFQYIGTVWIVIADLIDHEAEKMVPHRTLATFVLLSQGIKMIIDWLRLFDNTSFYVTLIVRTFVDIAHFLLIILILLLYVGCAMYMLHLNADREGEDTDIVTPVFGNILVDSTLHQFNVMIGEYSTNGFVNHKTPGICYALFVLTVIISQITFLNMLIAIMADTFERVIEQRTTFSLKNKLMILASMENIIRTKETEDDHAKVLLYLIMPASGDAGEDEEGSEVWRGKTHYTHTLIKKLFADSTDQTESLRTDMKQLKQMMQDQIENEDGADPQVSEKFTLHQNVQSLKQKQDSQQKQLDDMQNGMQSLQRDMKKILDYVTNEDF